MKRHLNVQLILQKDCKLIAVDFSDYNSIGADISNHVMLDFLVFKDENIPVPNSVKLRHENLNRGYLRQKFETEYILHKDGTYTYYKFVIPILNHFLQSGQWVNSIIDELFYYEGNIYWYKESTLPNNVAIDELLKKCEKLTNVLDIYSITFNNHATQTFYLPEKKIFSICKLNKCLVSLQKKLLFNNDCGNIDTKNRDFILSSMYVFNYLIDIGNLNEAQRLLDNMSSCDFCQQELLNNDCCCGQN